MELITVLFLSLGEQKEKEFKKRARKIRSTLGLTV
jgi:hypothetical protein